MVDKYFQRELFPEEETEVSDDVNFPLIEAAERTRRETRIREERVDGIMHNVSGILHLIGEDRDRDGLIETPKRVAKAYWDELFSGYRQDPEDVLKVFDVEKTKDMVVVTDLPVYSFCEHHMLPFIGKAHVAYLPEGRILGLSKFGRLVNIYARRLQVQERLTAQIANSLQDGLKCWGVVVVVEAEHLCMSMRGLQAPGTLTTTSAIRGGFTEDSSAKDEALRLIFAQRRHS